MCCVHLQSRRDSLVLMRFGFLLVSVYLMVFNEQWIYPMVFRYVGLILLWRSPASNKENLRDGTRRFFKKRNPLLRSSGETSEGGLVSSKMGDEFPPLLNPHFSSRRYFLPCHSLNSWWWASKLPASPSAIDSWIAMALSISLTGIIRVVSTGKSHDLQGWPL